MVLKMPRTVFMLIMLAAGGCFGQAQPSAHEQRTVHCSVVGDLEVRPFTSKVFRNTRMLRIWLPPDYKSLEHRDERYPVLYLNDGQDLFDACTSIFNAQEWRIDETATELIRTQKVPPL